jgi:glycosyltransferase involved in cell wall biosynthesis
MKLLYFTRGYAVHDARFLAAFREHDVRVGLLTVRECAVAKRRWIVPSGVEDLGDLGFSGDTIALELDRMIPAVRQLVANFAPTVMLAGPLTDAAYLAAQANVGCPVVAQSWAFDVYWECKDGGEPLRRLSSALHGATGLFSDSPAVSVACKRLSGLELPHRLEVPWGLDLPKKYLTACQRAAARHELGLGAERAIVHARSLEPVYSIDTLLKACALLYRRGRGFRLLLASDGSLRPHVEDFVNRHFPPHAATLLGSLPHDRLMRVMQAADGYVSCAASDGTSISLLEAMDAGLPVVVNDRGGNPGWIEHGFNGWVVPFGDPLALAAALDEVLALPPERVDQLAQKNRTIIDDRANWRSNFPRLIAFLGACAAQGRS